MVDSSLSKSDDDLSLQWATSSFGGIFQAFSSRLRLIPKEDFLRLKHTSSLTIFWQSLYSCNYKSHCLPHRHMFLSKVFHSVLRILFTDSSFERRSELFRCILYQSAIYQLGLSLQKALYYFLHHSAPWAVAKRFPTLSSSILWKSREFVIQNSRGSIFVYVSEL